MKKLSVLVLATLFVAAAPAWADQNFRAVLSGAEEVPPVETDTTGKVTLKLKKGLIHFDLVIQDGVGILGGPGGHIHCAPAGENGPVVAFLAGGLPVGLNGDVRIKATLDDGNIVDPTCGTTIAELVDAFRDGRAYVNIHSTDNPTGEIRGQIERVGRGGGDDDDDDDDGDDDDDL